MTDWVKKRTSLIKKLDIILKTLNAHQTNPLCESDVNGLLADLSDWKKEFRPVQDELIQLCSDDAAIEVQMEVEGKTDITIREIRKKLANILRSIPSSTGSSSSSNSNTTADVKLPRMDLPIFSGSYLEWTSFHDLFNSIIHANTKISQSQKLHYLKNSVRGEALGLINSLDVTDANYLEAWNLLKHRYENKRQVKYSHLNLLFDQPKIKSESAVLLRKLMDTTSKHIRALNALGSQTDNWDEILVHLVTQRLDDESRKQWELHSPGRDYPSYTDLKKFLEERCNALEVSNSSIQKSSNHSVPVQRFQPKSNSSSHHSATQNSLCSLCKSSHMLFKCPEYHKLNVKERSDHVKKSNHCFNCLRGGHSVSKCPSTSTCRTCNRKHHSSLHDDNRSGGNKSSSNSAPITSHFSNQGKVEVILQTAIVNVMDAYGRQRRCRALLDNGSQVSFVTESFAHELGLKRHKAYNVVSGIGNSETGRVLGKLQLQISSLISDFTFHATTFILKKITSNLPHQLYEISDNDWSTLRSINLADPKFNEPGRIDILLGADIYDLLTVDGKIERSANLPSAQNTKLGWIMSGSKEQNSAQHGHIFSHFSAIDVQDVLVKFWEVEELTKKPILTPEETSCELHFKDTHARNSTGRYVVALPKKLSGINLGFSRDLAIKRLQHTERRLEKLPQHKPTYHDFMNEYLSLGHMELIPPGEEKEIPNETYYLPHHFVLKESSSTTALRVVFDGSAKTTNGISLNEILMVGPRLQQDIFNILLRFRFYKYVFTADISKMFRQICVKKQDTDLQRIVWRSSSDQAIQDYRLTTVTYGTACGPYLATKALQQVANDEGDKFPLAKEIVLRDFYVDDLMSGTNSLESAIQLQAELIEMLHAGGFELRKWTSNTTDLLEVLPEDFRASKSPLQIDSDDSIKALGLHWLPAEDYFFFKVTLEKVQDKVSKRSILSDVARLFDPLGWLAPVIILGKILFQKLWINGLGWDDALPTKLENEWLNFRSKLFKLQELQILRHISNVNNNFQIHGFADASKEAYCAAIYVRSSDSDGRIQVHLLCAKTKVAPVKTLSIPRLELCGAVLLARLISRVVDVLHVQPTTIRAWTDSTVVLDWISELPNKWTTFVANRVSEIQGLVPPEHWDHVKSADNPADLGSRGVMPDDLLNNNHWFNGPQWLKESEADWPARSRHETSTSLLEERSVKSHTAIIQKEPELLKKFSSLQKLLRVTAWCLRFGYNSRLNSQRRFGPLSVAELNSALAHWIKVVQHMEFQDTIDLLKSKKPIKSNIATLSPFLDSIGLLRVGGRLSKANIKYDQKHPILLPKKCTLTYLIIENEHKIQLHAGTQLLLACLQQRYWIINGRHTVRQHVLKCIKCFRERATTMEQRMGDLPSYRVEPARPFLRTGVDYAGPINIKSMKGRGGKVFKAYISLFVCCATKAVHLELVTDLTSETFIAALSRFIARRGHCSDIFSDNGTNFVGADKELREMLKLFTSTEHNQKIADYLSKSNTTWHFIPARAPHFGGLWEAGVKSVKLHLRRIVGLHTMTFEELYTILTQIEACLNSRPLTSLSTDPNDLSALTPGHFLIGSPLTAIPEPDLTVLNTNRLSRYQLIKQISQHFWSRWSQEYINQLQQRHKWHSTTNNLKIGDLVIIKEDNLPPLHWAMARVVEIFPGADGNVRVASVKTANGILKRPITKLCLLPPPDSC